MKYVLSTLVLACMVLMPFAAEALEKPVAAYLFDDIRGDAVADASGSGNDGTMEDGPVAVDGPFGKGLEFEGSRVLISASNSLTGDLFQGPFTVLGWIKPKLAGNTWQQAFRALRAEEESNDTLFINNDGRLSWRGRVGGAWAGGMCETAAGAVAADTWAHFAVVGDTANFRIYVNGELAQESAFQTTDGANEQYIIGGAAGGESYSGAVDDLAVFAVALQQADIVRIMDGGLEATAAVQPEGKLAARWSALKSDL
jgi:hypothetical protein